MFVTVWYLILETSFISISVWYSSEALKLCSWWCVEEEGFKLSSCCFILPHIVPVTVL